MKKLWFVPGGESSGVGQGGHKGETEFAGVLTPYAARERRRRRRARKAAHESRRRNRCR